MGFQTFKTVFQGDLSPWALLAKNHLTPFEKAFFLFQCEGILSRESLSLIGGWESLLIYAVDIELHQGIGGALPTNLFSSSTPHNPFPDAVNGCLKDILFRF